MKPLTIYELLELLEKYHQQRHDTYRKLAEKSSDERAELLLQHLETIEQNAIDVIRDERQRLKPTESGYLPSGPTLTIEPAHAMDCHCDSSPSFDDALACAISSDAALDELIDRLEGSSPALTIQELASRLRDLERTKDREIAKFTRQD